MSDSTAESNVEAQASTATVEPVAVPAEPLAASAAVVAPAKKKGELPWWVVAMVVIVAAVVIYFVYQNLTAEHVTVLAPKKA